VASAATPEGAHRALWASPSHRGNLLDRGYERAGVAVVRDSSGRVWVTQLFAGYAGDKEARLDEDAASSSGAPGVDLRAVGANGRGDDVVEQLLGVFRGSAAEGVYGPDDLARASASRKVVTSS
jgi:hypothetical protein